MYRAVALWALQAGVGLDDLHRLEQLALAARIEFSGDAIQLNGEDVTAAIREPRVTEAASKVSMVPGVRRAMREEQRRIGSRQSVVMEGRDIGTVVFPDAPVKLYLTAAPAERARRRAVELAARGETVDEAALARQLAARDRRDSERAHSPLRPAADAVVLDTTTLALDAVIDEMERIARARLAASGP